MDTIIQFLKNENISAANAEQIDVSAKDIENINKLFAGKNIARPSHLRPKVGKNQIWSVKNEYLDFLGNIQTISHPLIVSIATDVDNMDDEEFVRVYVVSPFVEMVTEHDKVCQDISIIGFPFLIETWNEQPVLTEILDSYLGYYEVNASVAEQAKINSAQREFREVEISRAKFLNHSVMALLTYLENAHKSKFSASIYFFGNTQLLYCDKKRSNNVLSLQEPQAEYSVAAKSGISKEDECIYYHDDSLPFDIQIKKEDECFILTASSADDIVLFGCNNKKISGLSNDGKIVFPALKKGLYSINSKKIQEPLKIRLKTSNYD
jgi:hypothetical protein